MVVKTFSPGDIEINMSQAAIEHFKSQLDSGNKKAVRLYVKKSGCSGFMYKIDLVNSPEENDKLYNFGPVELLVSDDALPLLKGTLVDLVDNGINKKIQFNNPNIKAMCGCAESFTL